MCDNILSTVIRSLKSKVLGMLLDEETRIYCMKARRNIRGLIKALNSGSLTAACAAADALLMVMDKKAVPALIDALLDPSKEIVIRIKCARALGYLGDKRAVEPLLKALDGTELSGRSPQRDPQIQRLVETVVNSLALLCGTQASITLCRLLNHKLAIVRKHAAKELGYLKDKRALESLALALKRERNAEVKKVLAEAIQRIEKNLSREKQQRLPRQMEEQVIPSPTAVLIKVNEEL